MKKSDCNIMKFYLSKEVENLIIEYLTHHSCYYPFEWINSYKHLLGMQDYVPISTETQNEYYSIFKFAKEQCEFLLSKHPNSEHVEEWQEGIKEIDKILKLFKKQ